MHFLGTRKICGKKIRGPAVLCLCGGRTREQTNGMSAECSSLLGVPSEFCLQSLHMNGLTAEGGNSVFMKVRFFFVTKLA